MRKKILSVILTVGLTASLIGCGSSNEEKADTSTKAESVTSENVESEPVAEMEEIAEIELAEEKEAEVSYNAEDYEEQKDIFMVKQIDTGDGTEIDFSNQEIIDGPFKLGESIDIYSFFFTYAGYTKPNIKVDYVGKVDEWLVVPFAQSSFLVKEEDFDKVAVLNAKTENTINEDYANAETESASTGQQEKTSSQNEGSANSEEEVATASKTVPQEETPAPAVTTYSEEEVISIFRSTLESNGIQWYPSVYPNSEAGPSGGMGWGIENISMTDPYGDAAGTVEGLQFGGDKYYYLKLRTQILAMHLENSISGNDSIIKGQPFATLCC